MDDPVRDVLHARRLRRAGRAAAAGGDAAVAAEVAAPAAAPDGAAAAPGGDAGGVRVVLPIGRSLFRTVAVRAYHQKAKRVLRSGYIHKRKLADKTAAARCEARVAQKSRQVERVRSAHVARQRAVAQVWASGVATTYDEVLNPDLTIGISKKDRVGDCVGYPAAPSAMKNIDFVRGILRFHIEPYEFPQ